ncbi:MAG: FkbM family methyltransferase [Cyanobacteria bacterium SIG28]|nr:FkbM family methyltransferase [Cyanobacteria bacterium SIG28]
MLDKDFNINKEPTWSSAIEDIVSLYLKERYALTLAELDDLYGCKLCAWVTKIKNIDFNFVDAYNSQTVKFVAQEMNDNYVYAFEGMDFKPGDVVIDIGANVGMVSIYLAKRYPFLKIYSYEPVLLNFENLKRNLERNSIPEGIITAERLAVTADGRPVSLKTCIGNTGGSQFADHAGNGFVQKSVDINVPSITLEEIIKKHDIKKIKLLKIDCEGAEHEILYNCPTKILKKIEYLRGEFHENHNIKWGGGSVDKLVEYCDKYIKDMYITECNPFKITIPL